MTGVDFGVGVGVPAGGGMALLFTRVIRNTPIASGTIAVTIPIRSFFRLPGSGDSDLNDLEGDSFSSGRDGAATGRMTIAGVFRAGDGAGVGLSS